MKKNRPTALGVYIFAGGFTLGVKKHFDVLTHFEDGPYGTETAIRNGLIKEAHMDPATWPVKQYAGKVDFLYGNPPCAPWSMGAAGRTYHWTEDPRVNYVRRQFALLDTIKPKVWVWESVRPTFIKGRPLVNTIAAEAMKRGYHVTILMVDGANHGVAQVRKRMFVVLSKVVIGWEASGRKEPMTVAQAWGKRPFKTHTRAELELNTVPKALFKFAKPGTRLCKAWNQMNPDAVRPEGERMRGRPGFLKYRVHPDRPAPVLLGGAHLYHPSEFRLITVEEAAALCGYPRDFKFYGSVSKQYAQVAQAVMPPVAEYLAARVAEGLQVNSRVRKPGYERVEIFSDHVDRGQLDTVSQMTDGLKLFEPKPLVVRRPVAEQKRLDNLEHGRAVRSVRPHTGAPPWEDAKAPRTQVSRKLGSGARIRELLAKGWEADRILETVKKEFTGSKATKADVYWNRRQVANGRFSV